jgi:hypothetical protein
VKTFFDLSGRDRKPVLSPIALNRVAVRHEERPLLPRDCSAAHEMQTRSDVM